MLPLRSLLRALTLALCFLTPIPAHALLASSVRSADERYPCQPSATVLRTFSLGTGAPALAPVREALADLGAEIAYGPRTSDGFPGRAFVVVRAPRNVAAARVETA